LKRKKEMIPIVASLLGSLAENGLGLLSSAIQAKGKEVVEKTLGVKIPDNPTAEDVSKLRQLQYEHEERLLELGIEKAKMELAELDLLAKAAQNDADNITDRWQADMSSDSWLSKNIRPMTDCHFLGVFPVCHDVCLRVQRQRVLRHPAGQLGNAYHGRLLWWSHS
jgi:hypothetical protein